MVEREKGVATAPCPSCGTDLNAVSQPDGATAYEVCPKCYSQPKPETAAQKRTPRETGTTVETSGEEDN
jgi:hypothetical protein